jgi:hypothetical protein
VTRFREELSARRPTLAARLEGATLEFAAGELRIALAGDDDSARVQIERPSNRELLDAALAAAFGAGARWRLVESALAPAKPAAAPPAAESPAPAADPRVQTVLDIFGGSVVSDPAAAGEAPAEELVNEFEEPE